MDRCSAHNKQGGNCGRSAGWGTNHPGFGLCSYHGGLAPSGMMHAAKSQAIAWGMADSPDIDPTEALLWMVRSAFAQHRAAQTMVSSLQDMELVGPVLTTEVSGVVYNAKGQTVDLIKRTEHGVELNVWLRVLERATVTCAQVSAMAIKAGIAERQVRAQERYGEQIGRLIESILGGLELSAGQRERAPQIVAGALKLVEAGPVSG